MSILILAVALILVFRWRMNKVRRQMEEQFGEGFGDQAQGGFRQRNSGSPFADRERRGREGEVRVHRTAGTPEKRVSKDVGDYVDFEEEKER